MMSVPDYEALGYDIVTPGEIFGRSTSLMSGTPIYEGGYRAVSADMLFGQGSEVVEAAPVELLAPSFIDSALYQILVVASFVLYLHTLLRSWEFLGVIFGGIFGLYVERRMGNEGGDLPGYFKAIVTVTGVFMVALVGVRIADVTLPADAPLYDSMFELTAPIMSLVAVSVLVAWLYSLHILTGWISQSMYVRELSSLSFINFVRYVVLLFPLVAAWLVAPIEQIEGWTIALVVGTILLLLIYLKDTFVFFVGKKIPILYWILYLCTAFLLPLSFVFTMLQMRA
jgi:hypothetical protein